VKVNGKMMKEMKGIVESTYVNSTTKNENMRGNYGKIWA